LRSELPIACSLSGSDQTRRKELVGEILGQARQTNELDNGYEFTFPGNFEQIAMLTEFIVSERVCCPCFTLELTFEPEKGPIYLRLTGPEGTKEFIRDEISG